MSGNKRLEGRLALVTGASRGIGRAVARELAREGAHVIVTARSAGGLEEVDDEITQLGGSATILQLDLRKGERIDALGPTLYQRWPKLDILVLNAGLLGPLSPLPHVKAEDWAGVLDVNLTANWRLLRTLHPLLERSDAGRVIAISSGAAAAKYAYWGPYAVSKAGLEALAKTYALEVESLAVRCNIVNPGPVATIMRAKAFPGEDQTTLPSPADVAPLIAELALPSCTANGEVFNLPQMLAARKA